MVIISIIAVILLTILIVWAIDNFIPKKFKTPILISLWAIIIFLGYITFMSVYGEIQFNQLKEKRYKIAIENLKDREIKGLALSVIILLVIKAEDHNITKVKGIKLKM